MNIQDKSGNPEKLAPLTPELVLKQWSRTYNTQGKPDWTHIFPFYSEDIIFEDPIQRIEGKENFTAMCMRLTDRCEQLEMDITAIAANSPVIFMQWKMTMIFRNTPSTPLYGCSKLTLNDQGMIIEQRDYYDLWGDIFDNIPVMKRIYPRFIRRIFG